MKASSPPYSPLYSTVHSTEQSTIQSTVVHSGLYCTVQSTLQYSPPCSNSPQSLVCRPAKPHFRCPAHRRGGDAATLFVAKYASVPVLCIWVRASCNEAKCEFTCHHCRGECCSASQLRRHDTRKHRGDGVRAWPWGAHAIRGRPTQTLHVNCSMITALACMRRMHCPCSACELCQFCAQLGTTER